MTPNGRLPIPPEAERMVPLKEFGAKHAGVLRQATLVDAALELRSTESIGGVQFRLRLSLYLVMLFFHFLIARIFDGSHPVVGLLERKDKL